MGGEMVTGRGRAGEAQPGFGLCRRRGMERGGTGDGDAPGPVMRAKLREMGKMVEPLRRATMRRDLAGKRVILTGATGGIGRATAAELVRAGARLAIAARSEDTLADLAEDLRG